jgi:hypothetical protein
MLVHIANEDETESIRRSGIRIGKFRVVGWRYFPGANTRKMCGCPARLPPGTYKSRIFRQRFYDRD